MNNYEMFSTAKPEKDLGEVLARRYELGCELALSGLTFTFPGIDPRAYERLRNEEDEFPGYATPVDVIIARCETEGAKVVASDDPKRRDVYILPAGSDDVQNDSIRPKHLQIDAYMDGDLAELISISRL